VSARSSILLAVATCLLVTGCDAGGPLEIAYKPDETSGGGGSADAGQMDAPAMPDSGDGGQGAGLSPVLLGIAPTPFGEATPATALAADLATFGAGARAEVIVLEWDAAPTSRDEALSKRTAFYAEHGKRVVLNLAVVDRKVDHRPAALAGASWDSSKTLAAIETSIDALFASSGDEVRFLTLGRDVDVYLAAHPGQRSAFVKFARQACGYARRHGGAPKDLGVGVAFTPSAPKMETAYNDLLDVEDITVMSYFPGIETYEPDAASGAATVMAQLGDLGASKPIVLQAAGVPTDAAAGGSDVAQQTFFTTLLGAISAQRKSFALVNVVELNDAPAGSCSAWAEAQGDPPGGPLTAYACSLGLLRGGGAPKPAWDAVLSGAAALSTP
jgi:hypothetical protein